MADELVIVFENAPGPEPARFVEVENAVTGESVSVKWSKWDNDPEKWALGSFVLWEDAEALTARLVDAGQRLAGQAITWAISFHQGENHGVPFERCGNGACRSTQTDLADWEQAAGVEGHNWIAEQGRQG